MKRVLLSFLMLSVLDVNAVELRISLKDAEEGALSNSPAIAASRYEMMAASHQEISQRSYLFPAISLDGSYRWVEEIPSIAMSPDLVIQLTDHRSTSVGIGAAWQVWDWGTALKYYRAMQSQTDSRRQALRGSMRQALLGVRIAYFQVLAAAEQSRLVADSLKLAQAQYRDINARNEAGTASRADALAAHQEVLSWKRQLRAARGDLSGALRDLYSAMGTEPPGDLCLPLDSRTAADPPAETEPPSVSVALDPLYVNLDSLKTAELQAPDISMPQPALYDSLARGARQREGADRAALLPKVQVSARASYDYPNGPVLENIQQNTAGVSVSMPIFDWNRTISQARASHDQAAAYEKRRDQALADLRRDWEKAWDQLRSLADQQALNRQSVQETKDLAALTYDSYRSGRTGFLDVQTANLTAMQAAVLFARTQVQIMVQQALISAYSRED